MLQIRVMTFDDVPLGMRLKNQAGWNQTQIDWKRFIALQPDGCFVAELDAQPVGTATTCVLDTVGWIGMVLVEKAVRRQGIGTRLMDHCLGYLDQHQVATARLDATPQGRPIYEKLGFVCEYELVRFEGVASGGTSHRCVGPTSVQRLRSVLELDRQVRGTDRHRLIEHLFQERPEAMLTFTEAGKIRGYLTLREGSQAVQIGPGVALDTQAGRALGDAALLQAAGRTVFVDIPTDNLPAIDWAGSKGLSVQRRLTRMRRGRPVDDRPEQQWASSGPEKG